MHCVIASLVPETVTALSVELGNISEATTTEAPVISRISLIFEPPLPMSEPHCEAGMMRRSVMGGRGMAVPASGPPTSYKWQRVHPSLLTHTLHLMSTHIVQRRGTRESKHKDLMRWRHGGWKHSIKTKQTRARCSPFYFSSAQLDATFSPLSRLYLSEYI